MNKLIRSFGRIKSRKLSNHKESLILNLLPKYQIGLDKIDLIKKNQINHLEIGFGFGDFLFEKAKNNPDIKFIGCETHINGIVNLLSKLALDPLDNLLIFQHDVRLFLEEIDQKIFDKVYILFPDPWPKTKHHKRRLINSEFLDFLARKMKPNANLVIATDHDSYKAWILAELFKNKSFDWLANSESDWLNFPKDWVFTKYQKKAAKENRESIYIECVKLRNDD